MWLYTPQYHSYNFVEITFKIVGVILSLQIILEVATNQNEQHSFGKKLQFCWRNNFWHFAHCRTKMWKSAIKTTFFTIMQYYAYILLFYLLWHYVVPQFWYYLKRCVVFSKNSRFLKKALQKQVEKVFKS